MVSFLLGLPDWIFLFGLTVGLFMAGGLCLFSSLYFTLIAQLLLKWLRVMPSQICFDSESCIHWYSGLSWWPENFSS